MIAKCTYCGTVFDTHDGGSACSAECGHIACPDCEARKIPEPNIGEDQLCIECLLQREVCPITY